ncbi:hypothetical protein ACIA5A_06155 [Micromonospora sp. NPDC051300]|uniref:hypothetical protein n=1 Tax=Micromonospora sp. NPDC051300 TaxID=3364286 RepID=UPI0037B36528
MESSTIPAQRATSTTETGDTPATREDAFDMYVGGVALGLPIPEQVDMYSFRALYLKFDYGDTVAVDRWAAYLDLPAAGRSSRAHTLDGDTPLAGYSSRISRHQNLSGWSVSVSCSVPATAEEIAAARAEVTK